MKKVQIVYAIVARENGLYFHELWASVYSFRLYESERVIKVLCDQGTFEYISKYHEFVKLVDEIKVIGNLKAKTLRDMSKEIKTSVRQNITGPYIFVDTDTICASSIGDIDSLDYDVACVPEFHVPLKDCVFKHLVKGWIRNSFNEEISDKDSWFNSGIMFVNDTPKAYEICKLWHENWKRSNFVDGYKQDQPPLLITHRESGYAISELPGEYNCQVAWSVKYLANAKVIHFLHFGYPRDKSFNPFQSKDIYRKIKAEGRITPEVDYLIRNVKSIYSSPSCIVGWSTMNYLMSPVAPVFEKIYNEGGAACWLMLKMSGWLQKIHKFTRKNK